MIERSTAVQQPIDRLLQDVIGSKALDAKLRAPLGRHHMTAPHALPNKIVSEV